MPENFNKYNYLLYDLSSLLPFLNSVTATKYRMPRPENCLDSQMGVSPKLADHFAKKQTDIRSKIDIPYTGVAKLEKLFNVAPGGLLNVPIK